MEATEIPFFVPPISRLFPATAMQVYNGMLLKAFINELLSTLYLSSPMEDLPRADDWELRGKSGDSVTLKNWNPLQRKQEVYTVVPLPVTSDSITLQPILPHWAILGGDGWKLTSSVKSIEFPSKEMFEVQNSHLLVVVHCQKKVKISNNSKTRKIETSRHSLLIPSNSTVIHLVKAFKETSQAFGVFEGLDSEANLRGDNRTARELGWRHGTELRLQMW
ncbi:MAG: hypothetical protein M1818_005001 [Claussenomyces sp. TS43310]|nr:MAG: hypothetical protein M1818_005001 [Claussenomyces sp. TS43310]